MALTSHPFFYFWEVAGFLKQPYPLGQDPMRAFQTQLLSGLFVAAFLWVFRPFNIDEAPVSNPNAFILGYGLITAVFAAATGSGTRFLLPGWFNEERWTVGKNILFYSFIVFVIGLANFIYTHWMTGQPLAFSSFLFFQLVTISVSVLVVSFFTLLRYTRSLNANREAALELDREVHGITFQDSPATLAITAENGRDRFIIPAGDLLAIESADNYSKIYYRKEGKLAVELIRSSLRRIEEQIADPAVYRCHRSFLVNLKNIQSVSGNSQGYRIHFQGWDGSIPVARKSGAALQQHVRSLQGR